jgi:7-cyano-7-deazaguanine synthase
LPIYIILLSGGLDSAVNLAIASGKGEVVRTLFFDYGQKARVRECQSAKSLSEYYDCRLEIIKLPWLAGITKTALVDNNREVPRIDGETLPEDSSSVWVPNRNCVFVSIGASYAEALGADAVAAGFNLEEGTTFPDNSMEFLKAMDAALSFSTLSKVRLVSFTGDLMKVEIVRKGRDIGLPFDMLWFCYLGGEESCGTCESCVRFKRAISEA